jgi:hypothetical protein
MAISFKWSVIKVQVTENKLIVKVDLLVTGTNGENSASANYVQDLIRSDTFIPFEQLTEQQVLNWCFEPKTITWKDQDDVEQTTTKYLKDEGETQVSGQIARQLAKIAIEPNLPWAV